MEIFTPGYGPNETVVEPFSARENDPLEGLRVIPGADAVQVVEPVIFEPPLVIVKTTLPVSLSQVPFTDMDDLSHPLSSGVALGEPLPPEVVVSVGFGVADAGSSVGVSPVDGTSVGGTSVGGTSVGGTSVGGGASVGGTSVGGGASVGGTSVGDSSVDF